MNYVFCFFSLFTLSVVLTGCKDSSPGADCSATTISASDAYRLSAGVWKLVSIKSGWTSEVKKPAYPITLTIDDKQQAIVSVDNKEAVRFHFALTEGSTILIYKAIDISTNSYLIPSSGRFKVCDKQLILDATDVDGPLLIYERS